MTATLLRSQLRCPKCGDLISSIHRHDFQTCRCGALSIDGGRDYLRVAASDEVLALMQDDSERAKIDCSISIEGEHDARGAAHALTVYKALWRASIGGLRPASTRDVVAEAHMSPFVVSGWLQMLAAGDNAPVRWAEAPNAITWLPLVPLHERPDAP